MLDVGCGPGRIVAALTDHGRLALGIDIAEHAVALTRGRGTNALRRNVFDPLPGEGRWATVLLLDGNVGIGGDLDALLRAGDAPCSRRTAGVIVEIDPDDVVDESAVRPVRCRRRPARPAVPRGASSACDALRVSARRCGLAVVDDWMRGRPPLRRAAGEVVTVKTRPERWPHFTSPLRSTAVTARLGRVLGICFGICFVTGLLSHYQYHPWTWLPEPASPVWLYRVTQGVHVATGVGEHPAAARQALVGLPEPVPLAAGAFAASTPPNGSRCSCWSRPPSCSCSPGS